MVAAPPKAVPADPRLAEWVDATPFRALLRYLIDQTGLPWYAMPAATRTPFRMVRSLLFGNDDQQVRRIRYLDAKNLMHSTVAVVLASATLFVDASRPISRLPRLPIRPTVSDLVTQAGIEDRWAVGLLEGWLTRCPNHVLWRVLGYIELQEAALLPPRHLPARRRMAHFQHSANHNTPLALAA
ncbi:MAG: hypothetical protein LBH11_01985 [Propionibacteriaceae bacterium]|jgi:hypothetical protein|nr:hypothetical protein [Propionibacteriaceae bacterium]